MTTIGETIKIRRKEMSLTQKALCEGICTQATISNLENNQTGVSLETMLSILDRLKLDVVEVMDLFITNNGYSQILNEIKILCSQTKHKEAFDLLNTSLDITKIEAVHDKKEYYYYKGITNLIGANNFSDAYYNFNLGLSLSKDAPEFIDILSTNGIGIAYFMEHDMDKARTYFEKAITDLEEFRSHNLSFDSIEGVRIYFNTAKFYSEEKEYKKALDFVEIGINLFHRTDKMRGLENLLYEKAFNLYKNGNQEEATLFYFHAASTALQNGNAERLNFCKQDMKEFGIQLYDYS